LYDVAICVNYNLDVVARVMLIIQNSILVTFENKLKGIAIK